MAWAARGPGALGLRLLLSGLCLCAAQVSCSLVRGRLLTLSPSFPLQPSQPTEQVSWRREVLAFVQLALGGLGSSRRRSAGRRGASAGLGDGARAPALSTCRRRRSRRAPWRTPAGKGRLCPTRAPRLQARALQASVTRARSPAPSWSQGRAGLAGGGGNPGGRPQASPCPRALGGGPEPVPRGLLGVGPGPWLPSPFQQLCDGPESPPARARDDPAGSAAQPRSEVSLTKTPL